MVKGQIQGRNEKIRRLRSSDYEQKQKQKGRREKRVFLGRSRNSRKVRVDLGVGVEGLEQKSRSRIRKIGIDV